MINVFKASVDAWGSDAFVSALKEDMARVGGRGLPIAHVIGAGNRLDDSDLGVIINEVSDDAERIYAKVGVFFAEIVECLTCGGGSGMRDEAYCEVAVTIDKSSGEAHFEPL